MNSSHFFIAFLLILFFNNSIAQNIRGTVLNYNEKDVKPVPGILVFFNGTLADTTNENGNFGFITEITEENMGIFPQKFGLSLFPNPFNPTTTLKFSVPVTSNITILVYNILGQIIVSKIVLKSLPGTYRYSLNLNNFNLASQIVFVRALFEPIDKTIKPYVGVQKGVLIK